MARPTVPAAANLFGSTERAAEPRTSAPHRKVTIYAPIDLLADVDELATFLSRQGVTVDRSRMIREALRICLLDDQQEWIDALKRDEE